MVNIDIELDIVSAIVAEMLIEKNGESCLVDFLADEVKQTSFCAEGETNPNGNQELATSH